ncbi:hypothetical protein EVAR_64317_1 [Eumeta japonica]|uniref:Uncharacterized protein n=1 Tax=Eumeta variegata TaxID=151549 RepID=A0A4C2AA55_EUMVA|nr:hypothetical protein EVAR_64317_1 [Eumeta japonica]
MPTTNFVSWLDVVWRAYRDLEYAITSQPHFFIEKQESSPLALTGLFAMVAILQYFNSRKARASSSIATIESEIVTQPNSRVIAAPAIAVRRNGHVIAMR